MRKILIIGLIALFAFYIGSAIAALMSLARAVERGDGPSILSRTDQPALRRSIVGQVLDIYLERQPGQTTSRNRFLAQTVGSTIADAIIEKFLTPENVTTLLRDGTVAPTDQTPAVSFDLARLNAADVTGLISRIRISGIRRFAVRLSNESADESYAELLMELQPFTWKIVGLRLPNNVLRELAAKLPAK